MKGIPGNSKDLYERKTLNQKKFIADVCSDVLFHRKIAIRSEDVAEMSPHLITIETENGEFTELRENIRDGLYAVVFRHEGKYHAFYCGIEPQTKQKPDLLFRFLDYDVRTYREIMDKGTGKELSREEWDQLRDGEHLAYIIRNYPLLPVFTIHLNFSDRKYEKMDSIEVPEWGDCLEEQYGVRFTGACLDVHALSDEDLAWYGYYGILLGVIRYQNDLEGLEKYMLKYYQVRKMGSDMIAMINLYSNANLKLEEGEEEIGVFKAFEDLMKRGENNRTNEIAEKMLIDHEPLDKILRFTGLTMAQLNALKSEMAGR